MVCIKYCGKYTLGALGNEALLALLKKLPHLAAEYRRTAERHPCSTPRTCEIRSLGDEKTESRWISFTSCPPSEMLAD